MATIVGHSQSILGLITNCIMYITLFITYIFKDSCIFYIDWLQRSSENNLSSPFNGLSHFTLAKFSQFSSMFWFPAIKYLIHAAGMLFHSYLSFVVSQIGPSKMYLYRHSSQIVVYLSGLCLYKWISCASLGYFGSILYQSCIKSTFSSKYFLVSLLHVTYNLSKLLQNTKTGSCSTAQKLLKKWIL